MSASPSTFATPAEIRARLAFQKSEKARLRAEEDALLEKEAADELGKAEVARAYAEAEERQFEEGRQQLARLQAQFGAGMSMQTRTGEGKRKAEVIDLVKDETEGDSDMVRWFVLIFGCCTNLFISIGGP